MAFEVLHIEFYPDEPDKILERNTIARGAENVFDYLETSLMVQTSPVLPDAGVFIKNPELVDGQLYTGTDDLLGTPVTDQRIIHMQPNEELCLWSEFSNFEVWFINEENESNVQRPLAKRPLAV